MKQTKSVDSCSLKGAVAGVVALAAFSAVAGAGVWTDTTATDVTKGRYRSWTDSANWQDGYVPGGVGKENDSASFPTVAAGTAGGADMMRIVRLPAGGVFTNATVSGTARNKLQSYNDSSIKQESQYAFTDLSDYLGYVELGYPFGMNLLGATTINHLCLGMQPIVNVENAGDTVTVADTYGWGKLYKTGSGNVKFASWGGEHERLQVAGSGEVELTGLSSSIDGQQPAATPYIWLDASVTNGMTLVENEDGSLTVSYWPDVRGTVNRAAGPTSGYSCPKLRKRSEDGLWTVDFGDYSWEVPAEEQAARCARMSIVPSNTGRIFYNIYVVFRSNTDKHVPPLLGRASNKDMLQCTDEVSGKWAQYYATGDGRIDLKLGENRMDGNRIWFDEDYYLPGWHVLSATTATQTYANELCFTYSGGYGGARLAEVILYDRVLTAEENRQTIRYLQRKWAKGLADDRGEDWDFGVLHLNDDTTVRVPSERTAKVKVLSTSNARALTVTGGGTLETELVGTPPKGRTWKDSTGKMTDGGSEPMPVSVDAGTLRIRKTTPTFSAKSVSELFAAIPQDMSGRYDPSVPDSVTESGGIVTNWKNLANENGGAWYPGTGGAAAPTLVPGGINGLNSIDCRRYKTSDFENYPYFIFNNVAAGMQNNSQIVVELFMVMCQDRCGDGWGSFYPVGHMVNRWMAPMGVGRLAGGYYNATKPTEFGSPMPQAIYALDGVPLYQGTYTMITNAVVFSVANNVGMPLNTFGRYANAMVGGFEYGEIITYDRRLSPAERRAVETYLLKKWKNLDHPYDAARKMGATSVAAAGTLAVDAQAAIDVSGNLAVAEGGTLELGFAADETSPKAIVSGTLSLGEGATVRITSAPAELPENGRIVLARAATVDADVDALTVEAPAELAGGALKVRNGELRYQMSRGMMLIFR